MLKILIVYFLFLTRAKNSKKKLEIFTLQKQIEVLRFKISQMEK